jgi:hypothetical protein
VYDIATYLRIFRSPKDIRPRIIARYRALLRQIASQQRYDALLIVAHSQGSVLSTATLFGDPHRQDPEAGIENGAGVRGWNELHLPDLPRPLFLLTCGCPLRQSYDARLPGDYEWLWRRDEPLEPISRWINVYRPRDYIGQAIFNPPLETATQRQEHVTPAPQGCPVDGIDVCLKGSGNHTGYWTDLEFAKWVDYAIGCCLVRVGGQPPEPPYKLDPS